MGKIIYSLLLCLTLCLGWAAGGEAAQLGGPWRYYELSQPLPHGQRVPEFVRQNIQDWPAFDKDNRPVFKQGTERLLLAVPIRDLDPQKRVLLMMTAKQSVRMWLGDEYFFSAGSFQPQRFDEGSQPYMLSLPEFSGEQLLVIGVVCQFAAGFGLVQYVFCGYGTGADGTTLFFGCSVGAGISCGDGHYPYHVSLLLL